MNNYNKTNPKIKASFTIEASFIVPIALFTIVGGINIGYDIFAQAKTAAVIQEDIQKLDPVGIVRKNTMIGELADK